MDKVREMMNENKSLSGFFFIGENIAVVKNMIVEKIQLLKYKSIRILEYST